MTELFIHFSEPAKKDLKAIFDYGCLHWGKLKSRSFLLELKGHIKNLVEQPYMGVERPRLQKGMRSIPFNQYCAPSMALI